MEKRIETVVNLIMFLSLLATGSLSGPSSVLVNLAYGACFLRRSVLSLFYTPMALAARDDEQARKSQQYLSVTL